MFRPRRARVLPLEPMGVLQRTFVSVAAPCWRPIVIFFPARLFKRRPTVQEFDCSWWVVRQKSEREIFVLFVSFDFCRDLRNARPKCMYVGVAVFNASGEGLKDGVPGAYERGIWHGSGVCRLCARSLPHRHVFTAENAFRTKNANICNIQTNGGLGK